MAVGTLDTPHNGERIVIIGLVVQLVFFFSLRRYRFHVLYIAAGLIMIRSLFRLFEYAQGNSGYVISHEA